MKINTVITYFIVSVWAVLLIFGVLTLIKPHWLEDLSDPGKNSEALSMKLYGDNFLRSNKLDEAVRHYTYALKIVPDLEGAVANLGIAYQKMGYYDKAILSFNHLLAENKHPNIIYYNLGDIYEKTGQPDKAREYYIMQLILRAFLKIHYKRPVNFTWIIKTGKMPLITSS
jgi:tetratricopeptide (TPR) repeat protein